MFSVNTNRFGPHRPLPMCNNRQYGTAVGLSKQMESMKLQPEYLGNEPLRFLNDFGLCKNFSSDKKFVDINNSLNCMPQHANKNSYEMPKLNSVRDMMGSAAPLCNYNQNYNRASQRMHDNTNKRMDEMVEKDTKVDTEVVKNNNNNVRGGKKNKRNKMKTKAVMNDKKNQKFCRKSKKQRNFKKQSKREADRNVLNNMSRKSKNKANKNKKNSNSNRKIIDIEINNFEVRSESIESPEVETYFLSSPLTFNIQITNLIPNCSTSDDESDTSDERITNQAKINAAARTRLPSECESEDSFIVFEGGSDYCNDDEEDSDEDDEDTEVCSMSSDDEDTVDESDVTDFCRRVGKYQNVIFSDEDSDNSSDDFNCTSSKRGCPISASPPCKKVRFAEGKDFCMVHPMVQWSFAYQRARKGPWEQYALDRMRFKNRVSKMESILNPVLHPMHRNKIFKDRFQDN